VRPAPVGRPLRNEKCGQHGHATAAVVTARPAHGTCVRPAWSNRSRRGNQARQPMHHRRRTSHRDGFGRPRRDATRRRLPTSWQKNRRVVDNRLLGSPGVGSVALRWEASLPTCLQWRTGQSDRHEKDEVRLGPTRCDPCDARWGPLCTQAVDDGVDECHHGTNRALAPAHGWTSREHCDRREHRSGQAAYG
jgi:hypothetical protein